jgi:hypothetical protein
LEPNRIRILTEHRSSPLPSSLFRKIDRIDCSEIRCELAAQPEAWGYNRTRQSTLPVQRETESINIRRAARSDLSVVAQRDIHLVEDDPLAAQFPRTLAVALALAESQGGVLSRARLVRLRPGGRVYAHLDQGEYYRVRDRYHLFISCMDRTRLYVENQCAELAETAD